MTKFIMQTATKALKRSVPWAAAQGPSGRRLLALSPSIASFSMSSQVSLRRYAQTPTVLCCPQLSVGLSRPLLVAPLEIPSPFPAISGLLGYEGNSAVSSRALVVFDPQVLVNRYMHFFRQLAWLADYVSRRNDLLQEIRKVFTFEDKAAVDYYTGNEGYVKMNAFLRKAADAVDESEMVDGLVCAMKKLPAPVFKTVKRTGKVMNKVYRGTNLPWAVGQAIEVGGTYSDPGFLSTSAKKHKCFKRDYMFTIVCKTGVDVTSKSVAPQEAEVLFPPGTEFKITKVTRKGRECAVEMEEIAESS